MWRLAWQYLDEDSLFLGQFLVGHVFGGAFRANENFIVFHQEGPVLAGREDETVGLAVHGFRAERGGN